MPVFSWLAHELGIKTITNAGYNVHLLLLARFLRMFAYGSSALILALYFAALGHSDEQIGLFMTLTLLGDVLISFLLTLFADKLGRRLTLLLGATSMVFSGIIFALSGNYYLLLLAAIVGVISPSGNEIGPFRAVEESTIAHLTEPQNRSDVFAWYVVIGILGTAFGSAVCGWMVELLQSRRGFSEVDAYHAVFYMYAAVGVAKASLTLLLTRKCEPEPKPLVAAPPPSLTEPSNSVAAPDERAPLLPPQSPPPKRTWKTPLKFLGISSRSLTILLRLCALFSIDSLASGMVPFSLINFYVDRKFHIPKNTLGSIMSVTTFISSISNIFSSALSKRIGLVKTMVFTHLPSAIFLGMIPLPSGLTATTILLVARASLASMDQAPRSAFISAVTLPEERTAVMGIVNVVKTLSQSGGPVITGILAGRERFGVAFVVAGCLKASYDLGLLTFFVNMRLHERREERRDEREGRD